MSETGNLLSDDYVAELDELIRFIRPLKQSLLPSSGLSPDDQGRPGSIVAMLLEDLASGGTARAAYLVRNTTRLKLMLTAYGERDNSDASARITWGDDEDDDDKVDETIEDFEITFTQAEAVAKLGEFSFVNENDVTAQLGNHARYIDGEDVEFNVYRWLIKLENEDLADLDLARMSVQSGRYTWFGSEFTELEDTGATVEVFGAIPVGLNQENETPLQAGAVVVCSWVETCGYVVHAVESRQNFGEIIENDEGYA